MEYFNLNYVKKISLHKNNSYLEIEKLKKDQEVILINNVYNGSNNKYGQFLKVKVLDYYDSKDFFNQYKLLPDIIKSKLYKDNRGNNILWDLTYEDQESYIIALKNLIEKIKDQSLIKLFGLSHNKDNFKELSNEIIKLRLKN